MGLPLEWPARLKQDIFQPTIFHTRKYWKELTLLRISMSVRQGLKGGKVRSSLVRNCEAEQGSADATKCGVGNIRSVSFKSWTNLLDVLYLHFTSGLILNSKLSCWTYSSGFLNGRFLYFWSQPVWKCKYGLDQVNQSPNQCTTKR